MINTLSVATNGNLPNRSPLLLSVDGYLGVEIIIVDGGPASPPRRYRYLDDRLRQPKEKKKIYNDDDEVLMIIKHIVEVIL